MTKLPPNFLMKAL